MTRQHLQFEPIAPRAFGAPRRRSRRAAPARRPARILPAAFLTLACVAAAAGDDGSQSGAGQAAALLREAAGQRDPARRSELCGRAERIYADLVSASERRAGGGERERMTRVRLRMAWASAIFRVDLSQELDRFELTSGLAGDRPRLRSRLDQALALYRAADADLAELLGQLEADEERFLIQGIADAVRRASFECGLNLAWASVWRALSEGPPRGAPVGTASAEARSASASSAPDEPNGDAADRLATEALNRFERSAAQSADVAERQNAAIGRSVALRLLRRYDESLAALDTLRTTTSAGDVLIRAAYEQARTLLAAGRFEAARTALDGLILRASKLRDAERAPVDFYVQLAPLLAADALLLEAADNPASPAGQAARRAGVDRMVELTSRPEPWPTLVETYLAGRGVQRDPQRQSTVELLVSARGLIRRQAFDEAAGLLRTAIERAESAAKAAECRFELGVCLAALNQPREAGAAFDAARSATADPELAGRAAYLAYRSLAQAARAGAAPADYLALADACDALLSASPRHAEADEAAWIAAVARSSADRWDAAAESYRRIAKEHPRYWDARRAAIQCRRRSGAGTSSTRPRGDDVAAAASSRAAAADAPAAAKDRGDSPAAEWSALADDLHTARAAGDARATEALEADARLSAAEWLAGDLVRDYRAALDAVEQARRNGAAQPLRGRLLSLQMRCLCGLGRLEDAALLLEVYLKAVPIEQAGEVLLSMAASMEAEMQRLSDLGRADDARRAAAAAVPTLRALQRWSDARPDRAAERPAVRFSLARALETAGDDDEALRIVTELRRESPHDGAYLQLAARLAERRARGASGDRRVGLAEAEALWAQLLSDAGLRDRAPRVYWEARYRWLLLRFEGGHAADVARAIESERAWYPALGGPPWQGRLLELAEKARRAAPVTEPTP